MTIISLFYKSCYNNSKVFISPHFHPTNYLTVLTLSLISPLADAFLDPGFKNKPHSAFCTERNTGKNTTEGKIK